MTRHLALAFLPLALLGACAAPSADGPDPGERPRADLAIDDFADPTVTAARPEPVADPAPQVSAVPTPLRTTVGAPDIDPEAPASGERVVVDRVVGQINGKPVYAEEFYRDAEERWRELSRRVPREDWMRQVASATQDQLMTLVREELLLAEFRASLTPQQKQGLLAFVENLREQARREAGGSVQQAEAAALREYGTDLDTVIKNQAEREIIIQQLRQTIVKRVQVSTRDVELYYRRNIDAFQPQPVAVFRKVRVGKDDAETRENVDSIIVAGDFPNEGSTTDEIQLDAGGRDATTFYRIESLNDAARTLAPGEVAGPFEVGDGLWYLTLEALREQEQQSLYDVQIEIEEVIRDQRLREEEARYFERLLARSNVSEFQEMLEGLLEYASDRLYVAGDEG